MAIAAMTIGSNSAPPVPVRAGQRDGVSLAIDVWLPVERIGRGERVGTAFRATRYHRAEQPPSPEPEADSNRAAGALWTSAGFALVVADPRGTDASFGSHTSELGPREIADYSELIDWVAAQPWSNGRVGIYGTSYAGQAAELVASVGNPRVAAVAALFSPVDPYRELFYPGGCATSGRFARWMCETVTEPVGRGRSRRRCCRARVVPRCLGCSHQYDNPAPHPASSRALRNDYRPNASPALNGSGRQSPR